jgi:asparagine synthase (glutamine-hydrolysing)
VCGLAGIFDYSANQPRDFDESIGLRMLDAIAHRGPDDGGLLVAPGLLLGHRRLTILDLSTNGHQPMSDESQQCWIAYNGEVYNYLELRDELEKLGHRFRSRTDTEVILQGYLAWGQSVVHRLNGMFAWALWDGRDRSLWLVRDGIGIKPLFYHDDGRSLRFGSEIKAIISDDTIERRIDPNAIDAFLTFGYTPAPHTGFHDVRQLEPGTTLTARSGRLICNAWFRLPYPDRPTDWSLAESAERLEVAVDSAVNRQLVSDVPIGALLSGGLDSSTVVRSMRRQRAESIETFTIGFDDPRFDESPFAERIAKLFQTQHRTKNVSSNFGALLPILIAHAEEPFADNSMLPFYLLSEFVRQHVTVALSGDGADELLAGYETYRASALAPYYRMIPATIRRNLFMPLADRLPVSHGKYGLTNVLRRFVTGANEPSLRDHCSWRRYLPARLRNRLFTERFLNDVEGDPIGLYADAITDAPDWLTPLEKQCHVDLKFHLPNDMLVKVDRMSMAHSLEVRVPLLDLEVVRVCLAIPSSEKLRGKKGKLPLKQLLRGHLPDEIIDRKKAGFLIPLERWLQVEWQPLLQQFLTPEFAEMSGVIRWDGLRQMLNEQREGRGDHAYPLFALLVLGIWWQMWITRQTDVPLNRPRNPAPVKIYRLRLSGESS